MIKKILLYFVCMLCMATNPAYGANQTKIFGYDYYLGFPISDPKIQAFFNQNHITVRPYYNMDKMINDLQNHRLSAAFIPAGTLKYIEGDNTYQGITNATIGTDKESSITTYMIVSKKSSITNIEELQNKKIAYINTSCTTSYFAPRIFLQQKAESYNSLFSKEVQVKGFYQQIPSLLNGTSDATMIWDKIWLKDPNNANLTRIIGKISGLPTPVVVLNVADNSLKEAFTQVLISYKPAKNDKWLFSGFTLYQNNLVQKFLTEINQSK